MQNLFQRIADAKPQNEYGDSIPVGRHVLVLAEFGTKNTDNMGEIVYARFMVDESDVLKTGDVCEHAWFVNQGGDQWKRDGEFARCQAFIKALTAQDDPQAVAAAGGNLASAPQPGRGMRIRSVGSVKAKHPNFVNVSWAHVEGQTPENIGAYRGHLDKVAPVQATPPPAPPVQQYQQPGQAPAPVQQYQQPPQAPPPQQPAPAPQPAPGAPTGLLGLIG